MNTLQQLEEKFGFQYPPMYHQLFQNGMLHWGESSSQWFRNVFPTLKENPPLCLYANDFEFEGFQWVSKAIEELYSEDNFRQVLPDWLFIPFGQTAAGDYYCFFYDKNNRNEIPIVYLWHDLDEAHFLAKNLQDFIFRSLVEAVVDVDEESLVMSGDFYENLQKFYASHQNYLSENQQKIIKEIYQRKLADFVYDLPNKFPYEYKGLLSQEEAEEIIKQTIHFEKFEEKFNPFVEEELPPLKNIKGTMFLRVFPKPEANSPIYNDLKALNWRQNKNASQGLEYFRKINIFVPAGANTTERMNYLLDNFKDRIDHLKNNYQGVEVVFEVE